MGLLFKTAQDRAEKAHAAATRTKRTLEQSVTELRMMENLLVRIKNELPRRTPGSLMRPTQRTMERTDRYAQYTLRHMRRLHHHLKLVEEHIQKARQLKK